MKKAWIIAGSVVGVGAVAAGATVIALVVKGAKIDPINQPVMDMNSSRNILPAGSTRTSFTDTAFDNFEAEIDGNKDKLKNMAERLNHPDVQSAVLNLKYNDATIEFNFKIIRTGNGKFKVTINSVYLMPKSDAHWTLADSQLTGTKVSDFKKYARKFIYSLLTLDTKTHATAAAALTAVKAQITNTTDANLTGQ